MRNTANRDVGLIVGYVVLSFLLAALLSPPLYQIGKGFAEASASRETVDGAAWLAAKAAKATFPVYFKRALLISALILLFPLLHVLKLKVDPRKLRESRWSIYLPQVIRDREVGQPLERNQRAWLHLGLGLAFSSGFFLFMALLLIQIGWFQWQPDASFSAFGKALTGAVFAAALIAIVEEALFRGALLGIFLRAFRPGLAITLLSLLFAGVHFLQPPSGAEVSTPGTTAAGFEMLQLILQRLTQPVDLLYHFASLFVVGLILAYARCGTASLWLPIGLHAGWIICLKVFGKLASRDPDLLPKYDAIIGTTLVEGFLPLATLLLTWAALSLWLRPPDDSPRLR